MEINGLPLHPLVVHAAVIFGPLAALAALGYLVPRWRDTLRWPMVGLAVIATGALVLAYFSGGDFLDSKPELAEELLAELARARLADGAALPPDTVQMGSTLTYEVDGRRRRVTLVYPTEADIDTGRISVLTPIGTALIGLAEGQSIEWTARDGRRQRLTVVEVERDGAAA